MKRGKRLCYRYIRLSMPVRKSREDFLLKDNSYDACKVVKENFKLLEKKYNLFYDLSLKLKQIINNKDGQSVLNIIKKKTRVNNSNRTPRKKT